MDLSRDDQSATALQMRVGEIQLQKPTETCRSVQRCFYLVMNSKRDSRFSLCVGFDLICTCVEKDENKEKGKERFGQDS